MTKRQWIRFNRKSHRYLGVFVGIQFLFWTVGGLYFSWTNIKEIRGDHLKKQADPITLSEGLISPSELRTKDEIIGFELIQLLDSPVYRVTVKRTQSSQTLLFNALTGNQLMELTEKECQKLAEERLNAIANIEKIEYIEEYDGHHEYRGRPLPAYAFSFGKPVNSTVYVSSKVGKVETLRSNAWRVFDFFWMLHTMDYEERDNFNNWLIRAFSIFGLLTILSGFSLFFFTSKTLKRI